MISFKTSEFIEALRIVGAAKSNEIKALRIACNEPKDGQELNWVQLRSSDSIISAAHLLAKGVTQKEAAVVSATRLAAGVQGLTTDNIDLEFGDTHLVVKSGRMNLKLGLAGGSGVPALPDEPALARAKVPASTLDMLAGFKNYSGGTMKNSYQQAIFLHTRKGLLTAVGTDGVAMMVGEVEAEIDKPEDLSICLDLGCLMDVLAGLPRPAENAQLVIDVISSGAIFTVGNAARIYCPALDVKFPDYARVLGELLDGKSEVCFNTETKAIRSVLTRISALSGANRVPTVSLSWQPEEGLVPQVFIKTDSSHALAQEVQNYEDYVPAEGSAPGLDGILLDVNRVNRMLGASGEKARWLLNGVRNVFGIESDIGGARLLHSMRPLSVN